MFQRIAGITYRCANGLKLQALEFARLKPPNFLAIARRLSTIGFVENLWLPVNIVNMKA
jgi:hypothetical protein